MNAAPDLLSSIGICVGAAALLALIGWRLRQPLILAYLVTGVVIGPHALKWVPNQESISTVAEIGLILLLFMLGLEYSARELIDAYLIDDLDEADELLARPTAWLFGNEAWGLPDELAGLADHRVRIPIHGRAESLNLSTAAALCLYGSARAQHRQLS